MKVIFGLGNPGAEYSGSRHNVGYAAVSKLAKEQGVTFSEKTKFRAYVTEVVIEGEKVLLVKPTTFYNNVGESARAIIDFYKLDPSEDFLVIHDDLALPFGTIRIRKKGSDAGNNGIKSLNSHIGPDYARLRVGVGVEGRTNDDSSFVLSRFTADEIKILKETIIQKTSELAVYFLQNKLEETSYTIK